MTPKFPGYQKHVTSKALTFAGTLVAHWNTIAQGCGWSANTQLQYVSDYNNHILPYIPQHKALQDLSLEEAEAFLLHTSGYAEITVRHYRHLVRVVLQAGLSKNDYEELIQGSALTLSAPKDDAQRAKFYRIRKSLSIPQRICLLQHFLSEPAALSGEDAGLFLMFLCGLRNNEACAMNYEDLHDIPESTQKCLWVYKSTSEKSSALKASGKTENANRYLPVPMLVVRFLERRRHYLQDLIDNGQLKGAVKSAGSLPIACHATNYTSRCQADDLGRAAKKLFRNLPDFDMQTLSILDEEAHRMETEGESKDVAEKSPTAYLFRHDYATTIHCLGLTEAEIEYCIGHKMERTEASRNDYSSPDFLKEISRKLEFHPLNQLFFPSNPTISVNSSVPAGYACGSNITAHLAPGSYYLTVQAKEPNSCIDLSSDTSMPITTIQQFDTRMVTGKTLDMTAELIEAYQKEATRQPLKLPSWL